MLGLFGGSFLEPDPFTWLFGTGIGTNLGAALIGVLAGVAWSKTRYWPLNLIHAKLDQGLAHHKHAERMVEEIHHKMHTGTDHPRVAKRIADGGPATPTKGAK